MKRRRNLATLSRELRDLREEMGRIKKSSPFTFGTIVSVNNTTNVAVVEIPGTNGNTISLPATALAGSFVEPGHYVMLAMNGNEPVIMPKTGAMTSDPPEQVAGVTVESAIQSLIISWSEVSDFDVIVNRGWYEVQYDIVNTFDDTPVTIQVAGTKWVIDGFVPDTEIFVRVRAVDRAGEAGAWSTTASGTPTYVTTTVIADDSISTPKLQANSITAAKLAALTLEVGKYIRSTSFSTGVDGWNIDADGSAEFNDVYVRGVVEASIIIANSILNNDIELLSNGDAETDSTEFVDNGTFNSNITGWTGTNCTLASKSSSPAPQEGAAYLQLTATASSGVTLLNDAYFALPTTVGATMYGFCYGRAPAVAWTGTIYLNYYDDTFTYISRDAVGTYGASTSAWVSGGSGGAGDYEFPAGAVYGRLEIVFAGVTSGQVQYVDSVSLKELVPGWCNYSTSSTMSRSTSEKRSGAASVKSSTNGGVAFGTPAITFTEMFPVEELGAYRIDGYVKASAVSSVLPMVEWYDDTFTLVDDEYTKHAIIVPSSAYQSIFMVAQAPVGAVYGRFGINQQDPTTDYYFDDFTVVRASNLFGGYVSAGYVESQSDVSDATGVVMPVGGLIAFAGSIEGGSGESLIGDEVWTHGGGGGGGLATSIDGVPPGWAPCDGRQLLILDYWRLYSVIGTIYNTGGETAGYFRTPDLRGRVLVCMDNLGGTDAGRLSVSNTLGGTGGSQTHTLTTSEMPVHNHSEISTGTTTVTTAYSSGSNAFLQTGRVGNTTGNAGSGGSHNNMQPYMLVNYLIKC